jgi:hypothetical protein
MGGFNRDIGVGIAIALRLGGGGGGGSFLIKLARFAC